jgi:hypothetical protein
LYILKYIYKSILYNYEFIHKNRSIIEYLKYRRNSRIGYISKPNNFDVKEYIKSNVNNLILDLEN